MQIHGENILHQSLFGTPLWSLQSPSRTVRCPAPRSLWRVLVGGSASQRGRSPWIDVTLFAIVQIPQNPVALTAEHQHCSPCSA